MRVIDKELGDINDSEDDDRYIYDDTNQLQEHDSKYKIN